MAAYIIENVRVAPSFSAIPRDGWRIALPTPSGLLYFANDNDNTMSWQLPGYEKIEKIMVASSKEKVMRDVVAGFAHPPAGFMPLA